MWYSNNRYRLCIPSTETINVSFEQSMWKNWQKGQLFLSQQNILILDMQYDEVVSKRWYILVSSSASIDVQRGRGPQEVQVWMESSFERVFISWPSSTISFCWPIPSNWTLIWFLMFTDIMIIKSGFKLLLQLWCIQSKNWNTHLMRTVIDWEETIFLCVLKNCSNGTRICIH